MSVILPNISWNWFAWAMLMLGYQQFCYPIPLVFVKMEGRKGKGKGYKCLVTWGDEEKNQS